jgi:hypothetical protein
MARPVVGFAMVGAKAGDPLSMLVMECLSALITTVEVRGLFLPLGTPVIKHHTLFYADDVVVFV